MKAATSAVKRERHMIDISIHAAREGGDPKGGHRLAPCGISIHAAREGGDVWKPCTKATLNISIHAAREGGDVTISLY